MTTPEARNESPSRYSATSTAPRSAPPHNPGDSRSASVRRLNRAAAGTAEPYVVARLSWLAASSRSGGTRLGTVASLAGPHTRLTTSTSTVTTKTQTRRSEERTSELQSRQYLVCRLLLEKKK